MVDNRDIEDCVDKGMGAFDQAFGYGWTNNVDADNLDVMDFAQSPLAQAAGGNEGEGLRRLKEHFGQDFDLEAHGLHASSMPIRDALERVWRRRVKERQSEIALAAFA
jgi:hypothetical protein